MKDILISKKFNGFEVKVGCKELVFETKTKMMKEIGRYIANPKEVEREYLDKHDDDYQFVNTGSRTIEVSAIVNDLTTTTWRREDAK